MPERPDTCPDVNPARLATDPLLAQIAEMVAYMDLHIGRYEMKQMTTEQKELWADLVDAYGVVTTLVDEGTHTEPRRVARWWRPGHPFHDSVPTSGNDPRMFDDAPEPDPFVYTDEGGDRARGVDQPVHVDEAAARLARHVLLDVRDHTHPYWWTRHEDFVAVYEWAKQAVRPVRMTTGDRAGEIGSMRAYPSPEQAEKFLTTYRARRNR